MIRLYECSLPAQVKKVLHPIITCAVTADAAAYALGIATGKSFETTLGACSLPRFAEFAYLMLIIEKLHHTMVPCYSWLKEIDGFPLYQVILV